jgi:hypothetical protein
MQSRRIPLPPERWRPVVGRIALGICLLLHLCGLHQRAFAQTSATGETPTPLITDGLIQSNQWIWVITKDNKPIQMNITLQELQRLRDATSLPVHLSNASLELQIAENVVDVQARFSIDSPGEGVVRRFDLRMDNCQLTEVSKFSSEGNTDAGQTVENQLIPSKEGYRWLHLSSQAGKHTVSLIAKSLVTENSDRRSAAIELPLVTTALDIHLPPNSVEERVRNEDLIESRTVDEKGVHLKVRSRGGSFTLSWRQSTVQAQVAAVEAKCDTLFEPVDLLDPAQFWSATSTVTIRWYGNQASNKVQIVLPSGAQWSSLQNPKLESFRLTTLMPTDPNSAEILEIENLDPTDFPPVENLKLQWRWLPQEQQVDRFSARLKLPTPQVIGVDSTEGNIELVFPSSFQALFEEGNGVRFIRQIQTSSLADQLLFQYRGQSASVALTFRKEQFQPIIRPTYRVHAFDDKLELTAWYKCTFDGANTEVGLIPGEWTIDEDSVCRVMDEDLPDGQETQPLSVQKLEDGSFIVSSRSQEIDGEQNRIEQLWRFVAFRSLNPANGAIQFQLPTFDRGRPIGQKMIDHGSGTLLLSSQNYQLLQSEESGLVGLLPDSYSTEYSGYSIPQLRQPNVFRFKRQGATPAWKGQVRQLPRQVRFEQKAEIEVLSGRAQIKQDYKIHVSNRSLKELAFSIHESVTPLAATADGLTLTLVPDQKDSSSPWRTYQVAGLPELLGDVQLSLRTTIVCQCITDYATGCSTCSTTRRPKSNKLS